MLNNILKPACAAMLAMAAGLAGCTSYEIDMPANPELPAEGPEVSTSVIYQANPRFFAENECLKALAARVPAIAGMGCDVLWVMPVSPVGEERAFGSPYCIRDFKGVNPRYGSLDDFNALCDAAHAAGMTVILDWIANHTAWDHTWITEHPEYYVRDAEGNIQQASTWTDVAKLDYSNPATAAAMTDAMMFWLKNTGIDGFRCDHADGVPHEFWATVIAAMRAERPALMMLAESADKAFYADGFDMIYDWGFSPAMSGAFCGGKAGDITDKAADGWNGVPEGASILRYALNHDVAAENDVAALYGSAEAMPAAYVLAAMLHGTPMIYSSMDSETRSGKLSFFDYRPLEWSADMAAVYSDINAAYRASADARRGELRVYSDRNVVCFTRSAGTRTVLVAVNITGETRSIKTPIALAGTGMTDLLHGSAVTTLPAVLDLPAYGYAIYLK